MNKFNGIKSLADEPKAILTINKKIAIMSLLDINLALIEEKGKKKKNEERITILEIALENLRKEKRVR